MTTDALLAAVACGLYVAAAALAAVHMRDPSRSRGRDIMGVVGLGALCLAVVLLLRGLRTAHFPAFGGFAAACWYGLAVSLAYPYVGLRHEVLRTISAVVLPLVILILGLGLASGWHAEEPMLSVQSNALAVHVTAAFAGYGLYTLVALLGAAYLIQDRNLKHKRFGWSTARLPSLEVLDRVMVELISAAFLLFSVSIGLGVLLAHFSRWGVRWTTDPKVLTTAATWLVYALLFRLCRRGNHGRRVARIAVVGFVGVLVAFLGVHLVADSVHSFGFRMP